MYINASHRLLHSLNPSNQDTLLIKTVSSVLVASILERFYYVHVHTCNSYVTPTEKPNRMYNNTPYAAVEISTIAMNFVTSSYLMSPRGKGLDG